MAVTLTERGLDIDGVHVPVYSGSVHYWRLDREQWPLILDRVQALGFGMIETYIPWSVHEPQQGTYDWGTVDSRRDFEAFCRLCEERNLWLMVRPGPLINAEMTDFGYPEWVLLDPEVQSHAAVGSLHIDAAWGLHPPRPYPVPSYASETFFDAVGVWLDAVCPIIARHLAPQGCIVAVQSDNETCFNFQDQAYATDYSPASLAAYRRFLAERYGTIAHLSAMYEHEYATFAAVEPPRDCEIRTRADVPRHRDWVEYKERYIHESVARIARMLRERGVRDVPIFHDVAFQYSTPLDIARMEADPAIDWVGMNLYRSPRGYGGITRRIRYLAGTTRLPFVPEFGSGIWSHHPETPTAAEQEFVTLSALMHGMRAVNFYMLVERERWQGSPITRHGALRPDYADFYTRLSAFLRRYPLGHLQRQPQVITLLNYDLGRYAAMASTLHYAHVDLLRLPEELSVVDLDLGLRWDAAHEADYHRSDNWLGQASRLLKQAHLDYDMADTHIDPQRLRRYPIALVPTTDFMDTRDQACLLKYVEQGGTLVVGPGMPSLDANLHPNAVLSAVARAPGETAYGRGRIVWVGTEELNYALAEHLPPTSIRWDTHEIEIAEHVGGAQRLIYVANPSASEHDVRIRFATQRHLSPVWGNSAQSTRDTELVVGVAPYTIQIWEASDD